MQRMPSPQPILTLSEYIQNKIIIEFLTEFFNHWDDLERPGPFAHMSEHMRYLRIQSMVFNMTEQLNEAFEKNNEPSYAARKLFLQLVKGKINAAEMLALPALIADWNTYGKSMALETLMMDYFELKTLIEKRDRDLITDKEFQRLRQFTVLLDRCVFAIGMNILANKPEHNKISLNNVMDKHTRHFIKKFNLSTDQAKFDFMVHLREHFLDREVYSLDKIHKSIDFYKLAALQASRFDMFVKGEGAKYNNDVQNSLRVSLK